MPENITFRNLLLGSVSDFADSCQMGAILRPTLLVEIIASLSHYEEEGAKLHPEVYVCEHIDEILKLLPGHGEITIGELPLAEPSIKEILKKCAPLAIDGWHIYLDGAKGNIRFGLFRDSLNPLTVPIDEILFPNSATEVKVVRVHQVANDCVEIINHCGGYHNIFLSHKKESAIPPEKYLHDLVKSICERVNPIIQDPVKTYLTKVMQRGLRASHGVLITVCHTPRLPKYLSDGVKLTPPIDFAAIIQNDDTSKNTTLNANASLLMGMLNSDGIVVFSNDAKLIAYNCFISNPPKTAGGNVIGGARHRTYETLCGKIGKGTDAVFIQSQDGWSDLRKVNNA